MLTFKLRLKTTRVILHASHTPPSQSNIQAFLGVRGRTMGLLDVGYHYIIPRTGMALPCRPHNVQGAHIRGKANRDSIGVCLAGGVGVVTCEDCSGSGLTLNTYTGEPTHCRGCMGDTVREGPEDNFTAEQGETLRWLMDYLTRIYGQLPIVGHSELRPSHHHQCPPTDMEKVREWISQ